MHKLCLLLAVGFLFVNNSADACLSITVPDNTEIVGSSDNRIESKSDCGWKKEGDKKHYQMPKSVEQKPTSASDYDDMKAADTPEAREIAHQKIKNNDKNDSYGQKEVDLNQAPKEKPEQITHKANQTVLKDDEKSDMVIHGRNAETPSMWKQRRGVTLQ